MKDLYGYFIKEDIQISNLDELEIHPNEKMFYLVIRATHLK